MNAKEQLEILIQGASFPGGLEEFKERLEKSIATKIPLKIKYGADPSAPDIHLGHTIPLMKLRQFQDCGHEVIFIIGDFTARIGDPSGKTKTRPVLTEEQVQENAKTYKKQIFKILNPDKTQVVLNSTWFNKMPFADVIDIAARYNVARMLERNDFSVRFKNQDSITILEFFYPLIQAYDSVHLKNDIELGGTDQEFNFLVARDLMKSYGQSPQVVMTMPLLLGTDGEKKMSKSYDNYIGIDEDAVDIYGKMMSVSDKTMHHYNDLFQLLNKDLSVLTSEVMDNPYTAKHKIAYRLTKFFKGNEEADRAREHFKTVHQNRQSPDEIEEYCISSTDANSLSLIKFIQNSGLVSSQSEGRRMLEQGAVKIDGEKIDLAHTLHIKNGMVLQIGKRKFKKVILK